MLVEAIVITGAISATGTAAAGYMMLHQEQDVVERKVGHPVKLNLGLPEVGPNGETDLRSRFQAWKDNLDKPLFR